MNWWAGVCTWWYQTFNSETRLFVGLHNNILGCEENWISAERRKGWCFDWAGLCWLERRNSLQIAVEWARVQSSKSVNGCCRYTFEKDKFMRLAQLLSFPVYVSSRGGFWCTVSFSHSVSRLLFGGLRRPTTPGHGLLWQTRRHHAPTSSLYRWQCEPSVTSGDQWWYVAWSGFLKGSHENSPPRSDSPLLCQGCFELSLAPLMARKFSVWKLTCVSKWNNLIQDLFWIP